MAIGITGALAQGLATGPLARRFGPARVLTWGLALVGVGTVAQMLSPTWPIAMVGLFVVVFGQSLTFPNISALISQSTPPGRQGEVMGLNMSANCVARIAGPIWASAAFAHISIAAPFATAAALIVPGFVLARQVSARSPMAA
jgi:MFS family permease